MSLDAPIGDDDSNNFSEVVQDENADTPYEQLQDKTVVIGLERETPAGVRWTELVVAGGGALNPTLLAGITRRVGLPVRRTEAFGIPVEAREAVAFAILGAYRLRGAVNTLPRCTGASRAVSAGAVHRP